MAPHPDPTDRAAPAGSTPPAHRPAPPGRDPRERTPTGEELAAYLREQALAFLRALRRHGGLGGGTAGPGPARGPAYEAAGSVHGGVPAHGADRAGRDGTGLDADRAHGADRAARGGPGPWAASGAAGSGRAGGTGSDSSRRAGSGRPPGPPSHQDSGQDRGPGPGPGSEARPASGRPALLAHGPAVAAEAVRALCRSARRISGTLHTFLPLLDQEWAERLRPELVWLSATLAAEQACADRLDRLLTALHRLSGHPVPAAAAPSSPAGFSDLAALADLPDHPGHPALGASSGTLPGQDRRTRPDRDAAPAADARRGPARRAPGDLAVGAAKAAALLERRLTLARTRAHSTALEALGSARFHAVADGIALLASEVPLARAAAGADLRPFARAAEERLARAVAALPLTTAGHPYNATALVHGLDPAPHPQDAPWHQARLLLRLHRYAREALRGTGAGADPLVGGPADADDVRLWAAGAALNRHRDAAEAAAEAAQAARTPRIAPATAYALGVLHADQRHEVEAARYAFQRVWQRQPVPAP